MGPQQQMMGAFPKPRPVVLSVMGTVFVVWLVFALSVNWLEIEVMATLYGLLAGQVGGVLEGQLWRFLSAPVIHAITGPGAVSHMLTTAIGIYFLGNSLEELWGGRRFLRFLLVTALAAYVLQFAAVLVMVAVGLPSLAAKLVPGGVFIGGLPVVEAVAIAWALSFKGRTVLLMFVLPISSRMLIFLVVGLSVLNVIALGGTASGFLAPFFGMGLGWLLGAGTPSPLRRAWLKLRLAQLDRQARKESRSPRSAAARSRLRVIEGGGGKESHGPDGKYLN